jgi:hypothetical protein
MLSSKQSKIYASNTYFSKVKLARVVALKHRLRDRIWHILINIDICV